MLQIGSLMSATEANPCNVDHRCPKSCSTCAPAPPCTGGTSCPPAPPCEDDDDEAKKASGGTCAEAAAQGFCEHPQIGPTAKEL